MIQLHLKKWPEYDESKMVEDTIKVPVQINGKTKSSRRTSG